jgi:hypothetical protein
MMAISGIITLGPPRGKEYEPHLLVQKVNNRYIQHEIQIRVAPYCYQSGIFTKLIYGVSYEFRAYETGKFDGIPSEAYQEANQLIQARDGLYFLSELIIISGKKIAPISFSPSGFVGKSALLSGIAYNEKDTAIIQNSFWTLKLVGGRLWLPLETGKRAEAYGNVSKTKTKGIYFLDVSRQNLVLLKDQIGKTVKLRGTAWSMNNKWWLDYRGTNVYIENIEKLAGWETNLHGRPVEISGLLEEGKLPGWNSTENSSLEKYFIIRGASWERVAELLSPEITLRLN